MQGNYRRVIVVIFGALENLIHAGIIFGWPSLVYVLKDIGYYSELCDDHPAATTNVTNTTTIGLNETSATSTTTTTTVRTVRTVTSDEGFCEQQDAALVLVYTVATVVLPISMLPAGYLLLLTGTRISRIVFTLLMVVGYVCLALSSPEIPSLLYPAAVVLGCAGLIIILASFEIANLFPFQKSSIIGIMNGCYDTSTMMFLLVKIAYENGISLELSSLVLAGSAMFFNVNTSLLPKDHIPWPLPADYRLSCACTSCSEGYHGEADGRDEDIIPFPEGSGLKSNYKSCSVGTQTFEIDNLGFESGEILKEETQRPIEDVGIPAANGTSPTAFSAAEVNSTLEHEAEKIRDEEYPTFVSCLKSPMFFFMSVWAIVIQLQLLFVLGIMNPWLTWLAGGDLEIVSSYTNVLALVSVLSLGGGLIGGMLLDRRNINLCSSGREKEPTYGPYTDLYNSWLAVVITTVLSISYSICMLFRVLPLQYATFALLTLCRSMLYAVSAGVVPLTFPMRFYGIIYGVIYLLIGIVGFLQYPLFILIQNVLLGDPAYVMIGFILANLFTFAYPIYIVYYVRGKMRMMNIDRK